MFGSRKTLSMVTTASLIALGAWLTWCAVLFPPRAIRRGPEGAKSALRASDRAQRRYAIAGDSRAGTPAAEYRDLQGEIVARGPTPPAPSLSGPQSAQPQVPELPHPIAAGVSLPIEVAQVRSWSRRIMGLSDRPGALGV